MLAAPNQSPVPMQNLREDFKQRTNFRDSVIYKISKGKFLLSNFILSFSHILQECHHPQSSDDSLNIETEVIIIS